jgi:AmmeMemoRadiSam system protein A
MSSTEYSEQQQRQLLQIARDSISHGLAHGRALSPVSGEYDEDLRQQRATFVTLHKDAQLRGCIGTLQAHQPLVDDVAEHAYAAAFRDPRFPPLSADEVGDLELHISVLSVPEEIPFGSERELLEQIMPGEDGLILEDVGRKGTFLPSVWEQLPDKAMFLAHLKQKAGLPANYWSDTLRVWRYRTNSFSDS